MEQLRSRARQRRKPPRAARPHFPPRLAAGLASVFVVGLLLGLSAASFSPPFTASVDTGRVSRQPELPWAVFQDPLGPLARVSKLIRDGDLSNEDKLLKLEALAGATDEPPLLRGLAAFAAALRLFDAGRPDRAVKRLSAPNMGSTELSAYALFFIAKQLEPKQPERARDALSRLIEQHPDFAYRDEAGLRLGRLLARAGRHEQACQQFRWVLEKGRASSRGEALFERADALQVLGRKQEAVPLLEELYYEMPLNRLSRQAGRKLRGLRKLQPPRSAEAAYGLAFERAERLFRSGRFREADADYNLLLKRYPKQADRELIRLRRGVCQYRRRHNRSAETTLGRVQRDELKPEALYYRAEAARRLRKPKTYKKRLEELLRSSPNSPWAEEALWSLARFYVVEDDMLEALGFYKRLVQEFPKGKHTVDAQWRLLWDLYRNGRYAAAASGLERTAREHPETEELPRLLYWSARSYENAGGFGRAQALYRQVLFGYKNTYYGRRAQEHLARLLGPRAVEPADGARQGLNLAEGLEILRKDRRDRIGQLVALGLYDEAATEAERAVQGEPDDAAFLALAAWVHFERGRFRKAIITLRRAFPFHVSATGDLLPREVWSILFPLRYRGLVERYAHDHDVDPYIVLALIRQESTFNPRVRSRAGARGLMQIMPHTGRRLARAHRRRFRSKDLYDPEINIWYGTHYLKDVLDGFQGRLDYALAAYNAGPHRVRAWTGMDFSLDPEEFIEEIPFTETRNYVKLVLRNEMLYRRLYRAQRAAVD